MEGPNLAGQMAAGYYPARQTSVGDICPVKFGWTFVRSNLAGQMSASDICPVKNVGRRYSAGRKCRPDKCKPATFVRSNSAGDICPVKFGRRHLFGQIRPATFVRSNLTGHLSGQTNVGSDICPVRQMSVGHLSGQFYPVGQMAGHLSDQMSGRANIRLAFVRPNDRRHLAGQMLAFHLERPAFDGQMTSF